MTKKSCVAFYNQNADQPIFEPEAIPPYAYKNLQRIRTIYNCSDKLVSGNRCPKKRMELGFTKMFFQASLQS